MVLLNETTIELTLTLTLTLTEVVGRVARVSHMEHVVPTRVGVARPAAQHLEQQLAQVERAAVAGRLAHDDEEQVGAQPAECGVVPAVLLQVPGQGCGQGWGEG